MFEKSCIFALAIQMVDLAQLVRVPDCGSEGRGFESHLPPSKKREIPNGVSFFVALSLKMRTFAPSIEAKWQESWLSTWDESVAASP